MPGSILFELYLKMPILFIVQAHYRKTLFAFKPVNDQCGYCKQQRNEDDWPVNPFPYIFTNGI